MTSPDNSHRFFICGSALRGQPDHHHLQAATFIKATKTQPNYRMHAVGDDWHPGVYAVESGGIAIPGEVYALTQEQYDQLLAAEPPNLYAGKVILEDGEEITAMLYPQAVVQQYNWPDISHFGGWAAYKQSRQGQ